MSLIIGWYYHLPPCFTQGELHTAVVESLTLLLRAHETSRATMALAITGHALEQVSKCYPEIIDRIHALASDRIVELVATTYYEVSPHLIPSSFLSAHLQADIDIKQRLFNVVPETFWPGNFAWTPILGKVLADAGIKAVLLEQAHLEGATSTQIWKWLRSSESGSHSDFVKTGCSDADCVRPYRLQDDESACLDLFFRPEWSHKNFSRGVEGCIHKPWDRTSLDIMINEIVTESSGSGGRTLFLGDDGDRINAVSSEPYIYFLDQVNAICRLPSDCNVIAPSDHIEYLCAHAPEQLIDTKSVTASSYLVLLDEVYRYAFSDHNQYDSEIMPLQDVFPLFWPKISRCRWFYNKAWSLLDRMQKQNTLSPDLR